MRGRHSLRGVLASAGGVVILSTFIASILAAESGNIHMENREGQGAIQASTAGAPPGDDIDAVTACPFCGMDRRKFAHSRVFIQYDDGSILGACSLHCAAVDMAVHLDKNPKFIWVGEYRTRNLIDAETAVWVVGGSKMGVMTRRAKWAFDTGDAADQFITLEGGKTVSFEEAVKAAYEDMYEDTKMIRERRKAKRMTKH